MCIKIWPLWFGSVFVVLNLKFICDSQPAFKTTASKLNLAPGVMSYGIWETPFKWQKKLMFGIERVIIQSYKPEILFPSPDERRQSQYYACFRESYKICNWQQCTKFILHWIIWLRFTTDNLLDINGRVISVRLHVTGDTKWNDSLC